MLDYRLWQNRLEEKVGCQIKKIGFAADVKSAISKTVPRVPALFVIPKDERAQNRDTTGSVNSLITAGADVLILARDHGDVAGGKATDNLMNIDNSVFQALVAWTPDDADCQVKFRGSKRIGFKNGILIWSMTFDCQYLKGVKNG